MSLPLPGATGPTTSALVLELPTVKLGEGETEAELVDLVEGINANLRRFLAPGGDGFWAPDHTLGATLLAAQVWKRRSSGGAGVEFSPAGDPVYIQRNHPDIARLLGLGPWVRPVVG
jgi:hypothetical protein